MSPLLVAGSMIILAVGAFVFLRPDPARDNSEGLQTTMTSQTGSVPTGRAAQPTSRRKSFLKAVGELTGTSLGDDGATVVDTTAPTEVPLSEMDAVTSSAANSLVATGESADPALESEATRSAGAPPAATSEIAGDGQKSKANGKSNENSDIPVAFLWVEVSKEWLHLMGASEPGFHPVPDLETRLREAQGAYNIISATRHEIRDKSDPIDLAGPDRTAMRFDLTTTSEVAGGSAANGGVVSLSGQAQTAGRPGADGSIRAPTTVPITIHKGEGTILNLGKPTTRTGTPSSTAPEIVVLILPRWGDDRNP